MTRLSTCTDLSSPRLISRCTVRVDTEPSWRAVSFKSHNNSSDIPSISRRRFHKAGHATAPAEPTHTCGGNPFELMRESEPRINFAHTFDIGLAVFSHLFGTAGGDVVPDFGTVDVLATEFAALCGMSKALQRRSRLMRPRQPAPVTLVVGPALCYFSISLVCMISNSPYTGRSLIHPRA